MMKRWCEISLSVMWVWIVAIIWLPVALADTQVCTKEEAQSAEAIAALVKSWGELHQYFKRYAHCDDGAIAEGFSESITLLLAEHWGTLRQLKPMVTSDVAFRKFIIWHIDETVPAERLKQIAKNAGNRCPRNLKDLCHDIQVAASQIGT